MIDPTRLSNVISPSLSPTENGMGIEPDQRDEVLKEFEKKLNNAKLLQALGAQVQPNDAIKVDTLELSKEAKEKPLKGIEAALLKSLQAKHKEKAGPEAKGTIEETGKGHGHGQEEALSALLRQMKPASHEELPQDALLKMSQIVVPPNTKGTSREIGTENQTDTADQLLAKLNATIEKSKSQMGLQSDPAVAAKTQDNMVAMYGIPPHAQKILSEPRIDERPADAPKNQLDRFDQVGGKEYVESLGSTTKATPKSSDAKRVVLNLREPSSNSKEIEQSRTSKIESQPWMSSLMGVGHGQTRHPMVSEVNANVIPGSMQRNRISTASLVKLADGIKTFAQGQGGEMKIKLQPEGLGELTLRVATHGNQVDMSVHATNDQAKQIIQESLHDLKTKLSNHNLNLARAEVSVGSTLSALNDASHAHDSRFMNQNGFDQNQSNFDFNANQQSRQDLDAWQNHRDRYLDSQGNGYSGASHSKSSASRGVPLTRSASQSAQKNKAESGRVNVLA